MLDLVIRGGCVIDGTGRPAVAADIGVAGDRIVAVGGNDGWSAHSVIDAARAVVCPGFIDMHSHSDLVLPDHPAAENMVRQGITTEVVGQCGYSPAPIPSGAESDFYATLAFFRRSAGHWPWRGFAEYLEALERARPIVNVVPLIGHGPLRMRAVGFAGRALSADELRLMCRDLEEALEAGAWGFSTGLAYAPGCFAEGTELVTLAQVAAAHDGIYFTHIRDESGGLVPALEEAIAVGETAGVGVQVSHFKAAGRHNWDKHGAALRLIEEARARGSDVSADVMAFLASGTTLSYLVPDWVKEGGPTRMADRLQDATLRERIRADVAGGRPGWIKAAGFENIYVFAAPSHPEFQGRDLTDIGAELRRDSLDVVMDLLVEDGPDVFIVFFTMCEENLIHALSHPAMMIGSDGWAHPGGASKPGLPHPRAFGTYPRILGEYVREKRVLPLETAIHKMTGMPAAKLGLRDRGAVRDGMKADLVVFRADEVRDLTTFTAPAVFPEGIDYVVVNGCAVITPDGFTGNRVGHVLRKRR